MDYVLVSDGNYVDGGQTVPAGMAVNRILWDGVSNYQPPSGTSLAIDDGTHPHWTPPTISEIPPVVPKWKLQIVMHEMPSRKGLPTLLDDANAIVSAVGGVAQIAWQNATDIQRDSPTLAALAPGLGLSDAEIDAAFVAAESVIA